MLRALTDLAGDDRSTSLAAIAACGSNAGARFARPTDTAHSMARPTPYPELNSVLADLVTSVTRALGEAFVSACLQGSFAVGDFDRHSDVDFVIVVAAELTDGQVNALQAIHRRLYGLPSVWAQHLEGSYFPAAILRSYDQCSTPLWYLDHGSQTLVRSTHCNTLVVRWVVREHGVILAGPSPATLLDPVPVDALRQEIGATMRDWGQQILDDPDRYRNRFYQAFIVLNYCRMMHDLVVGCPLLTALGMDVRTRLSRSGSLRTPRTSRAPCSL